MSEPDWELIASSYFRSSDGYQSKPKPRLDSVNSISLSGSSCWIKKRNAAGLPKALSVLICDSSHGMSSIFCALDATLASASIIPRKTAHDFLIAAPQAAPQ